MLHGCPSHTQQHIAFVEGRGNLIIEYASSPDVTKVVSFVGSHLDVVPADPKDWCACCCVRCV